MMDVNSQPTRYDYFLIWGNGLQHKDGILEMIRKNESFDVLKIIEYTVPNVKKFVQEVYAHDYAPYEHLKGKTRYLLSTPPQVVFVFVKNKNIDEAYFGDGEFLHTESKTVKKIKEEIRDKYNERKDERRTENHVIHASDNETQTSYILQYLGYPNGVAVFEPRSHIISVYNLGTQGRYTIENIPIEKINATILIGGVKNPSIITEIRKSPHYKYASGDKTPYLQYVEKFQGIFLQDDHSSEKFDTLISSFDYLGSLHPTDYIMLKRIDDDEYLILDGLHRAAILSHRGATHIICAVIE